MMMCYNAVSKTWNKNNRSRTHSLAPTEWHCTLHSAVSEPDVMKPTIAHRMLKIIILSQFSIIMVIFRNIIYETNSIHLFSAHNYVYVVLLKWKSASDQVLIFIINIISILFLYNMYFRNYGDRNVITDCK